MAQIASIEELRSRHRPPSPEPRTARPGRRALADAAFVGQARPLLILASVVAIAVGASPALTMGLLLAGMSLWFAVVLDAAFPVTFAGRLEQLLVRRVATDRRAGR